MKVLILAIALALIACRPTLPGNDMAPIHAPAYATSDRDGLETELGVACLRLRRLGCPEGFVTKRGRTCFEHLTTLTAIVEVPTACVKAAATQDDVRACGNANTTRFRCIMPAVDVPGSTVP